MTPPKLSDPTLVTVADLTTNQTLASEVTDFIVRSFRRSSINKPEKWDLNTPRFSSPASLFEMLGNDGLMCFTCDLANDEKSTGTAQGSIVACAAAIPWTCEGEEGYGEKNDNAARLGWEIKVVCVDGDVRYAKTGLAVKTMACLEDYLVQEESKAAKEVGTCGNAGTLPFWIIAAECINGVYWRKRGYTAVRKRTVEPGMWGCKTTFEMVVLRKDVKI